MESREGNRRDPGTISRWMIDHFGFDAWVAFCTEYGGQKWWIPIAPAVEERNEAIRAEFDNIMESGYGVSMEAVFDRLAEKWGLSTRWIRKIIYPEYESEQNFLESSDVSGGLSG